MDEVRYYLGLAHELNGNKQAARKAYYEVIAKTPSSKLVPLCYFAFGEMFFLEAATDPSKNELALQSFLEALKYPPPDNTLYPEALLRQGQTYLRQKDDAKAAQAFARLRRDHAESAAAAEIPAGH
jgi:tetratricopeptide (TPR) repeat protein